MKTTRDFLEHTLDDDGECPSGCDVYEGVCDATPPKELQARHFAEVLAAALPEVASVEELEALPAGSIVSSGGREFYKTSYIEYPWILPYGVDRFGSEYLAKHSKVTVMHLPEFES